MPDRTAWRRAPQLAAAGLALLAAGCATSTRAAQQAATHPATAAAVSQAANVHTCGIYAKQRTWAKNLVQPDLADAVQWITDVGVDSGNTTPGTQLARDLNRYSAALTSKAKNAPDKADSARVLRDCQALGIHFAP